MADYSLLEALLGQRPRRSLMDPPDPDARTAGEERMRGVVRSLLGWGAGTADAVAETFNPGLGIVRQQYPGAYPSLTDQLDNLAGKTPGLLGAVMGDLPASPYDEGALLGDIASLLTPAGWVNRARSVATKAAPSSLARQAGAILPKRGAVDPVEASLMSLRGHQPAFKYPVGAPSNPSGQKIADAFDPTGKTVFQQEIDGSASFWNPQTNARVYVRPDEQGRMFINAQESAPGQDSGRLWQMAQQYMRNQGIREITDPAGYTPAGSYRSISHGISSAIRNDDASHLGAMAERNMPTLRTMADTESKLIRERLDSAGAVNEMIDKGRLRFDMSDGRLRYQDNPKRPVTDYTQADFLTDFGRQGMSDTSVGYDSLRRALLYEQLRRLKEPVDLRPLVKSPLLYGAGVPVLTGGLLGPPDTP